ncbi:metallophosphoesterase family protein [Photorhabdus tasmaniensis]|uniref:Calcineurin-like phosphoesterase domain-containing protein n=1 Tax=Photorhabdus tasmaniensis TaxID=1004159 RepID=A0ABX0GHG7_9GAMM|nr:metallophosphoesterase [Photorhabdus tasmaniensis]NHB88244.1 hypothetical protein [Photorhabdus tasmaniensis]
MRILQLTDIHIFSNYCDLKENNDNHYIETIKFILKHKRILNIDALVITGDISHDGGEQSYKIFFQELACLNLPYAILPGNHDNPAVLLHNSIGQKNIKNIEDLSNDEWSFISLNSVVEGKDYGKVDEDEIEKLEEKMRRSGHRNIALFLHHHLLPVGTPLVDICNLQNTKELLTLCQKYPVKFVGSGHAHTLFQRKIGDLLLSVSPAVCYQWENGTNYVNTVNTSGFNIISFNEPVFVETYFI